MSFELRESYPLKPEVDTSHDLSKGLRRHLPACYDERGNYIDMGKPLPFLPCVAVCIAVYAIGWAVL